MSDTGSSVSDGVSSERSVQVYGLDVNRPWEFSLDGSSWFAGITATGHFDLPGNGSWAADSILLRYTDSPAQTYSVIHDAITIDILPPSPEIRSASYDSTGNTLVFSGVDFDEVLHADEDHTTDIKERLDWSKLTWDHNSDNDSTNNVSFKLKDIASAYVVNSTDLNITLTNDKAIVLEGVAEFDPFHGQHGNPQDSLIVSAGFTADLAGNVASTDDFVGPWNPDTSVVVFDMAHGVSSAHSGRHFDSSVSYTIYAVIDSDSFPLMTHPTSGAAPGASWGQWTGGDNLGADDQFIIVGDNDWIDVVPAWPGGVKQTILEPNNALLIFAWWSSQKNGGVALENNGRLYRNYLSVSHPQTFIATDLWTGSATNFSGPATANNVATTNHYPRFLPPHLLMTQGLI